MTESLQHQGLVIRAVNAIFASLGEEQLTELLVDAPDKIYGSPPTIYGHRPDLYASTHHLTVIGEAKPPWDVESARTELQLSAFTKYVEADNSRHLILAVHWVSTATISSVLRSLATDWPNLKHRVHILDGQCPLVLPVKQKQHATV